MSKKSAPDKIRFKGATYVKADEYSTLVGTFAEYLANAEKEFFKKVSQGVRKLAGGHAESIEINQGRPGGVVWFEYKGQDKGDIDFNGTMQLVMSDSNTVKLHWKFKNAMHNKPQEGSKEFKIGVLRPEDVIHIFERYFGV